MTNDPVKVVARSTALDVVVAAALIRDPTGGLLEQVVDGPTTGCP